MSEPLTEKELARGVAAYCPNCDGARRDWLLIGGDQDISLKAIIEAVALETGIRASEITGKRRDAPAVRARHMAMFLARKMTARSLPVIGRAMGGLDHTAVLYGVRRLEGRLAHDDSLRALEARCAARAFAISRKTGGDNHA